jgi:hypothetical protein
MKIIDEVLGLRPKHFFTGLQIYNEETDGWFYDLFICSVIYLGVDYLMRVF